MVPSMGIAYILILFRIDFGSEFIKYYLVKFKIKTPFIERELPRMNLNLDNYGFGNSNDGHRLLLKTIKLSNSNINELQRGKFVMK